MGGEKIVKMKIQERKRKERESRRKREQNKEKRRRIKLTAISKPERKETKSKKADDKALVKGDNYGRTAKAQNRYVHLMSFRTQAFSG